VPCRILARTPEVVSEKAAPTLMVGHCLDELRQPAMRRCNLSQVLRQIVEGSEVSTKYNDQAHAVMELWLPAAPAGRIPSRLDSGAGSIKRPAWDGDGFCDFARVSQQIRAVVKMGCSGMAACGCQGLTITMSDSNRRTLRGVCSGCFGSIPSEQIVICWVS